MRTLILLLLVIAAAAVAGTACDETMQSNFYDLGVQRSRRIGDPCGPDVPPNSECGYPPQFYCSPDHVCASACNADADCRDGSVCVGAGDMSAGECRQSSNRADGGMTDGGMADGGV